MNDRLKDTPIPIWMQKLKKDKRGYPIPVNVLVDKDGRPHFTINAEDKRQAIIKKDQCPICGNGLLKRRASVGGPACAFHPHGAFIDPPMHLECARYALQVCPYLAAPSYAKRIDDKTLDRSKADYVGTLIDNTMDPRRPVLFVMVIHTKQSFTYEDITVNVRGVQKSTRIVQYVKPTKPYHAVEYWQYGNQLPDSEGLAMAKEALMKDFGLLDILERELDAGRIVS